MPWVNGEVYPATGAIQEDPLWIPDSGGGGGPTVAPTFAAASASGETGSGDLTVGMTVASPSSSILFIAIGQGNSGGTPKTITSVTWSGNGTPQAMTVITGSAVNDGNFCSIVGYYLVNPTAQTGGTITVDFATNPAIACGLASHYTGANQTPVLGTPATNSTAVAATVSVSVTPGTGRIAWGACATDANGALTIGGTSSPTQRRTQAGVSADMGFAIGDTTGTGTFKWDWTAPDNGGAMFAVNVDGL